MGKVNGLVVELGPHKKMVKVGKWYPFDTGIGEIMYLGPTLKLAIAKDVQNLSAGYMVEVFGQVAKERPKTAEKAREIAEGWAAQVLANACRGLYRGEGSEDGGG